MDNEAHDLKRACRTFEEENGVEAFLDAMAEIMTERMAAKGLELRFFDDEDTTSADRSTVAPATVLR